MSGTYELLIHNAVDDLLGGRESRAVTVDRAQHVLERLANQVRLMAEGQYLSSLRTVEQAAAELGISDRRVRAIAQSRNLGWRTGRDWLFRPQDIEAMRERRPGRPREGGRT